MPDPREPRPPPRGLVDRAVDSDLFWLFAACALMLLSGGIAHLAGR